MIDQIGILMLAELDPAGRTGGDHGQRAFVLDALQKLRCFLPNGKIGCKVGIKHTVKAEAPQRSRHFALNIGAHGQSERFAKRCTDCGGGVHDDGLFRIAQRRKHFLCVIMLHERAGRTGDHALPACHAGSLAQLLFKCAADIGIKSALVCADHADRLCGAACHAAAAENAFVVVTHEPFVFVFFINGLIAVEAVRLIHIIFDAKTLQLAIASFLTAQAGAVMGGKDQFQCVLSCMTDLFGVGAHLHSLAHGIYAGGYNARRPETCAAHLRSFHNADAASSDFIDFLQIAQGRHIHPGGSGCLKDRRALWHLHGNAVNNYIHHIHCLLLLPFLSP